jgi:hypothetical protein
MKPDLFDSVRLLTGHPEVGLEPGAIGVVVHCFEDPPAYEVEFCDGEGQTIAELAISPGQLALETDAKPVPVLRASA